MPDDLLERSALLGAAGALIARAREGAGGVLVFEGPAGIGKSSLLAACAGAADGLTVACVRPTELERSFAFGVVRGLLGPLLVNLPEGGAGALARGPAAAAAPVLETPDAAPAGDGAEVPHAVLHGLLWLLGDAAARRPVLLVIDDAHGADDASLAWLAYAAPRLGETAAAVLVGTRPVEATDSGALARLLAMRGDVEVHAVPALTRDAVRTVIGRELGADVALRAAGQAAEATGGNPFLLAELVLTWQEGEAGDLRTTLQLRRAVARRIAALGPDAAALADAVAILGGADVALPDAAALAGLGLDRGRTAADALAGAHVLERGARLTFVHPLVREAVYESVAPFRRAAEHARAAHVLAGAGQPADVLAPHLLLAPAAADPWVVAELRRAAEAALARGAPGLAMLLLRRALDEPPPEEERAVVLHELGEAAARAHAPEAAELLERALAEATGERAARISLTLGRVLLRAARGLDAAAVLKRALPAARRDAPELALHIEAEILGAARAESGPTAPDLRVLEGERPHLRGSTSAERVLLASLACEALASGLPADAVWSFARRALAGDRLVDDVGADSSLPYLVTAALWSTDRCDAALAHLDAALEHARARGSVTGYALVRAGRAGALMRMGRLPEAEADASDALAIAAEHQLALVVPLALPPLIAFRVERGELDLADSELRERGFADRVPSGAVSALVRHARGRLRSAQGRWEDAAADFLATGEVLLAAGIVTPMVAPWRSDAALAFAAAGRRERAIGLAAEELTLTRRAGVPSARGIALRAEALVGPAVARVPRLAESVECLERGGHPVELARTLVDLGVAQLRRREREEGRASLRRALDLADRVGAVATAGRAQTELAVAGARPRRRRLSGPEALTAAEARVARLAAEGRTNREIAGELFLSLKTVETHLGHVFAKLAVRRRSELPHALAAADGGGGSAGVLPAARGGAV